MAVLGVPEVTLSIIIGTLAAIVYSLRVLVLLDRKIARVETHIERMANAILKDQELMLKRTKGKKPGKSKIRKR